MIDLVTPALFKKFKKQLESQSIKLKVMSNSMAPLIHEGEEVEVERFEGRPKPFDIIVFWNGKILIGHYVWHLNEFPGPDQSNTIITRCLVSRWEDLPVREDQILGRIISHQISPIRQLILLAKNYWHERWSGRPV